METRIPMTTHINQNSFPTPNIASVNVSYGSLKTLCERHGLFQIVNSVMHLPIVVQGQMRIPKQMSLEAIQKIFQSAGAKQSNALYHEDHVILRDGHLFFVLPMCQPQEIICQDHQKLWTQLFSMPYEQMFDYTKSLKKALQAEAETLEWIADQSKEISELPEFWHYAGFTALSELLDEESIRTMTDVELSQMGIQGSTLLDNWVLAAKDGSKVQPEPIHLLAQMGFENQEWKPRTPVFRAMPTRQLHITAGNAPHIPLMSLLRGMATKSAVTLKLPSGAFLGGVLLGVLSALYCEQHPFHQFLSILYWKGGDLNFEQMLYLPTSFDRIAVWGSPESVAAVKAKAPFTKVISFNPRFGMSLIGREVFINDETIQASAERAVCDSLIANQKACIASLVHYVEGDAEQIKRYAKALQTALKKIDVLSANKVLPIAQGDVERWKRGALIGCQWYLNEESGRFSSGVVIVEQEVNLAKHPMCRLIVLRPVSSLRQSLNYMTAATSTVSVFPESRRLEMRDEIASRGVSQILPLGESGSFYAGMSHDGMRVLSEMVEWKNA